MPIVVAFIVLVISVATLGNFFGTANISQIFQLEETKTQEVSDVSPTPPSTNQNIVYQKSQPGQTSSPKTISPAEPQIFINTNIQYGPRNGETVSNTNKITFGYGATVLPENTEGKITFETRVIGLSDWQESAKNQTTIEFPAGPKTYTFQVRAKINNQVDPTPAEKTFNLNISPYYAKVDITNVRIPTEKNPSLITIYSKIKGKEEINISGWQIEGKWGKIEIPQGIEDFNPLAGSHPVKDILIKQGDIIYISSEVNPLGPKNWNFRPNACMGYLTYNKNFPIAISRNCPSIDQNKLPLYLEKCCKEYISTLGRCQSPKYEGMKSYGVFEDPNCWNYIDSTFNYGGCYANHYLEPGFSLNQWHIYLDRIYREIMDRKIDTIYLWDQNGLLVDEYSYGSASCCQ